VPSWGGFSSPVGSGTLMMSRERGPRGESSSLQTGEWGGELLCRGGVGLRSSRFPRFPWLTMRHASPSTRVLGGTDAAAPVVRPVSPSLLSGRSAVSFLVLLLRMFQSRTLLVAVVATRMRFCRCNSSLVCLRAAMTAAMSESDG
ncbi:hypothetical protein A2U01_0039964, partial [Trifolium medium]|nr:hypothetical protein [Trifolium medium]